MFYFEVIIRLSLKTDSKAYKFNSLLYLTILTANTMFMKDV